MSGGSNAMKPTYDELAAALRVALQCIEDPERTEEPYTSKWCGYCGIEGNYEDGLEHEDDCPYVIRGRIEDLLARLDAAKDEAVTT